MLGIIIFNLSINKHNKKNKNPFGIDIAFFVTGVILYTFITFIEYKFSP